MNKSLKDETEHQNETGHQSDDQSNPQIVNEDHTSQGHEDDTDQYQNDDDRAIEMLEYMSRVREGANAGRAERTEPAQTPEGSKADDRETSQNRKTQTQNQSRKRRERKKK